MIYKTTIQRIGDEAALMSKEEKMIVLFGEGAPDMLRDYVYEIPIEALHGSIEPGMSLWIDHEQYRITSVGEVVEKNLANLGHITIQFNGATEPTLPGALCVEEKEFPDIQLGSTVMICEE